MPLKLSVSVKALRIEWPTVMLVVACYGTWLAAAFLLFPVNAVLALAVMTVAVALHSSLQHEALHGHPTRNAQVNEALVFLPLGLAFPYRRFRDLHLKHHNDERLTDPYDDPESFYRAAFEYERLPAWFRSVLTLNNTLAGRLILGPAIMTVGFIFSEMRLLSEGNTKVRRSWMLHGIGLVVVLLMLSATGIPVWLYVLTAAYGGLSLISIRTYAEHQWSERPNGRTIIVEKSPFALLFLNNNLHLVHHKHPTTAWYELPGLYEERRDEWHAMNGGYVFRNYWLLFRNFAFRPKEPVVHPILRRLPEPGRNLHPKSFAATGESISVPAEPPKK